MTHRMDPQFQQSWCVNTLYYNITIHFFSNTLHLRQKLAQHFISQWVNINWIFIGLDSWRWMSYKQQERFTLREHMGSPRFVLGSVLLIFFGFRVVFLCLFVSFVPNVASVSAFFILYCPFGFSNVYLFFMNLRVRPFYSNNDNDAWWYVIPVYVIMSLVDTIWYLDTKM
jgi:hypothetical protein